MATQLRSITLDQLAASVIPDRSSLSQPSPLGAMTHTDENIVRVHSAAADGTMSAYADEIADYFDRHESRTIRSLMQSNRAPFLS